MYSVDIQEAFRSWLANRAYIDGRGNYHIKTGENGSGPIAPWNTAVKKAFVSVFFFAKAAHNYDTQQKTRMCRASCDTV